MRLYSYFLCAVVFVVLSGAGAALGASFDEGYSLRSDCNSNGIDDGQDLSSCDGSPWCTDCNTNSIPDVCDIESGVSDDCNFDGRPDECLYASPDGYALYLNGVDQYVDFGTPIGLTNLPMNNFTVEMWIRTTDTSRSVLLGNYNGNPSWNIELHDTAPAGHPRLYLDGEDHHAPVSVADGKWHHLTFLRNIYLSEGDDGYVRMYVDGVLVYSADSTKGAYTVPNSTMLGRDPRPGSHYFKGVIDEVRVFALQRMESDIRGNMYTLLTGDEPAFAAYWRLDDGEGSVATDVRGYSPGTITNEPEWVRFVDDCNANEYLDECEIAECAGDPACDDCNQNGILDECDIAECEGDPACDDCNLNGVPDACDIGGGHLHYALEHRYRFDDDGVDSVGHADAEFYGDAVVSGGALVLDGDGDYVELPIGETIGTAQSITLEAWVTWQGGGNWQRVFDIGTSTNNYMFFSPFTGGDSRFAIRTPSVGEQRMYSTVFSNNTLTHVAVTIDHSLGVGTLYIDGAFADENTGVTLTPSDLGTETIGYLGKSFWPDPYYNGSISEFRIYDAALSPEEVLASFTAGPDAEGEPTSVDLNTNGIPDECDIVDCNGNEIPDDEDLLNCDGSAWCSDCNSNGILDECDILACEGDPACDDCNLNGIPDSCDLERELLHPNLRHLYHFDVDGEDAAGGADAIFFGDASVSGGALVLDGDADYAELPIAGTISVTESITLEAWVNRPAAVTWERVFAIGTGVDNWMYLTPSCGGGVQFSILIPGVAAQEVNGPFLPVGVPLHLVAIINHATSTGSLYVNGMQLPENHSMTLTPADLGASVVAYLGKSFFDDPYFQGEILEFRIYDYPMSPEDVIASFEAGPDAIGPVGSEDVNSNGIPDECETYDDCNENGIPDEDDLMNCDGSAWCSDCNANGVLDECDILEGIEEDCNANGVPDSCELIVSVFGMSLIENTTGVDDSVYSGPPDDVFAGMGNGTLTWDFGGLVIQDGPGGDVNVYEVDYGVTEFGLIDVQVSADGSSYFSITASEGPMIRIPGDDIHSSDDFARSYDLSASGLVAARYLRIVGLDSVPGGGTSGFDLDGVGVISMTVTDCNENGILDECDIADGVSLDLNGNGIPDECEPLVDIYPALFDCWMGPNVMVGPACLAFDFTFDGDVDLEDYSIFSQRD